MLPLVTAFDVLRYFIAPPATATATAPPPTGLLKVATDAESKKIWTFLSRDFDAPEHQTAALKNAYALVGQKKYAHDI